MWFFEYYIIRVFVLVRAKIHIVVVLSQQPWVFGPRTLIYLYPRLGLSHNGRSKKWLSRLPRELGCCFWP